MKQKVFALLMGAALCLSLSGCQQAAPAVSGGDAFSADSVLTSEDDSAQMETVEMDGLTFQYDAKFSCEEGNIVFEEGKSYLLYMESSSGGSDSQEESDDGPLYHEFILDMLGITPEQEPAEMQIDGKRALRSKSQNDTDGVVVHYDLVTFKRAVLPHR